MTLPVFANLPDGLNPMSLFDQAFASVTSSIVPVVNLEAFGGGVSASQNANSAAVVSAAQAGFTRIVLGPGTYNFNPISSITHGSVIIEGQGDGITTLSWTTGTLLTFDGGFARIYGCAVRNCTLYSPDVTNTKTAILVVDGSGFTLENVTIKGAGTNSILTGGTGSTGLQTKGREFFRTRGAVTIAADKPIVLSKNPNVYISCDLYHLGENLNLVGGTANPVITVDPGVMISNTRIRADFELGTHGFYWNDTGTYNHVPTINAAGAAYTAGDTLTVSGGTGTAATIKVVTVSGGTITSAAIINPGNYSVAPGMPVSVTGGTGNSATFTLNNVVSNNLTIEGRSEQGASVSSNNIYIAPNNSISSVNIIDFSFDGARKGLFLKNTIGTTLLGTIYIPAGATEGINADLSNEALTFVNTRWFTGTTSAIGGLAVYYKASTPTGYALPPFAAYSATASGMTFTGIELKTIAFDGSSSGATILQAAATASGTLTLPAGTTNFSATGGANQVVKQASAGGAFTVAQVAAAEVSGLATSATTDTTNATNITTGTLANGRYAAVNLAAGNVNGGVTGATPLANGGTGQITAQAAQAALKGVYMIGASAVAAPLTGTLTETALATITIPANSMGANGIVRVWYNSSVTNNANAKTLRVRFSGIGGTQLTQQALASTAYVSGVAQMANRNATNSQVFGNFATLGGFGITTTAPVTAAVDTTSSQTVVISGQLGNVGDTITLESYMVELIVP